MALALKFSSTVNSPAVPLGGIPFPGEALTSPLPGQWYADGVPILGEVGTSYTVSVLDVGKEVRCGKSLPLQVWHPRDVAQVNSAWVNTQGIFHDANDTPAMEGDTVYRWTELISGYTAEQATGVNQPLYRKDSGTPYLAFDGVDDILHYNNLDIFRAAKKIGCLMVARGYSPSQTASGCFQASRSGQFAYVMHLAQNYTAFACRYYSGGVFPTVSSNSSNAGWVVYDGLVDGDSGEMFLSRDGVQAGYTNNGPTGVTDSGDMEFKFIGQRDATSFDGDIAAVIAFAGDDLPSTQDLNRLRQYAGLLVGKNLGLPIA